MPDSHVTVNSSIFKKAICHWPAFEGVIQKIENSYNERLLGQREWEREMLFIEYVWTILKPFPSFRNEHPSSAMLQVVCNWQARIGHETFLIVKPCPRAIFLLFFLCFFFYQIYCKLRWALIPKAGMIKILKPLKNLP